MLPPANHRSKGCGLYWQLLCQVLPPATLIPHHPLSRHHYSHSNLSSSHPNLPPQNSIVSTITTIQTPLPPRSYLPTSQLPRPAISPSSLPLRSPFPLSRHYPLRAPVSPHAPVLPQTPLPSRSPCPLTPPFSLSSHYPLRAPVSPHIPLLSQPPLPGRSRRRRSRAPPPSPPGAAAANGEAARARRASFPSSLPLPAPRGADVRRRQRSRRVAAGTGDMVRPGMGGPGLATGGPTRPC